MISPPSFLLLPFGGMSWSRGTTCSPHFAPPSSPAALLPEEPASSAGFICRRHWQPLLFLGGGLREEGLLREQMVPVGEFGDLQVGEGGVPFHRSAGGGLARLSHGQFPAERLYGITPLFI